MTWPWATHLRDACADPGDPYLIAWTFWWDYHGTLTQPLHLFDAPIFYPHHDTFAYSENAWGLSLPLFPLFSLGVTPLAACGVATLLGFTLSGFGAFRLARTLTGSAGAGWVAGIAFGFAAYRFHHLPQAYYVSAGWMALLFEAAALFARQPSRKRAAWLSAAFFLNAASVIHWFVLSLIPLGATFLLIAWRHRTLWSRDLWRRGTVAIGTAGLALLPFFLPYLRLSRHAGFIRNEKTAAVFSARPSHWLAADSRMHLWAGLGSGNAANELCLFPGVLVPLLAVLGLSRRRNESLPTGAVLVAFGFFGSLGMNFFFHRFLFEYVPLFRSIRVPARWAMVANLGLALLAALGALVLAEKVGRRRRGAATAAYTVICAALLFELRAAPLKLYRGAPDPDPLTRKLAETPMRGGLVELPAGRAHGGLDVPDYSYVLRVADHRKPLVNATSGFGTREASRTRSLLQKRPIPDELLDLFESIPVSYVTVREAWLLPHERDVLHDFLARGVAEGRLRFQGRFDPRVRADLYAVTKTEPDAPAGLPLPWTPPRVPIATTPAPGPVDLSLTGGLDGSESDFSVRGPLRVSGWARIPGEDLGVTILIDGEERTPLSFRRVARDDVARALPRMGDCSSAGFEATYARRPDDGGRHELLVLFNARDGRYRPYPMRRFTWSP